MYCTLSYPAEASVTRELQPKLPPQRPEASDGGTQSLIDQLRLVVRDLITLVQMRGSTDTVTQLTTQTVSNKSKTSGKTPNIRLPPGDRRFMRESLRCCSTDPPRLFNTIPLTRIKLAKLIFLFSTCFYLDVNC